MSLFDFIKSELSVVILLFICWTNASKAPVEPGVPLYSLKQNNSVLGLLQGNAIFYIHYLGIDNVTNTADLHLAADDLSAAVTGTQTSTKTEFIIATKTNEGKNIKWTVDFQKNDNRVVMIKSSITINKTDLSPKAANDVFVTWTNTVDIGSSSNAYQCSDLVVYNDKNDKLEIKNVRIQPFDVKNGNFSSGVLCTQDQPMKGDWNVTQISVNHSTSYSCIHMTGFIYLLINYTLPNKEFATATVLVPSNAIVTASSTCNYNFTSNEIAGDQQILQLRFSPLGTLSNWFLTMNFTNDTLYTNDSENKKTVVAYYVRLDYYYDPNVFPDIDPSLAGKPAVQFNTVNTTSGQGALNMFKAYSDRSYRCNANETTAVTSTFWVETESLNVEAYLTNSTSFLTEHVCALDQSNETSDLIPIIIGAALAALVVVVLVAYLIGRARTRGSNYETI